MGGKERVMESAPLLMISLTGQQRNMQERSVSSQTWGWLDNDFNTNDELIETDIDTLPSEIAESLKGEEYDECVVEAEKKMEKMAKKKMKKCTYSEEDIAKLDDLGTGIAHTECFKYIFKKSCKSYLKNSLADALGGIMTAAGK